MAKRKVFEAVINAAAGLRKLGGTHAERMARAAEQGYSEPVYRGIYGDYNPDKSGNYQMFTSSPQDAGEYGNNIIKAKIRRGNNLEIDGGGKNFNNIYIGGLPSNVLDNFHPRNKESLTARTDDIAYAAKAAGYDSVTIKNVYDKANNEIPIKRGTASGKSDIDILSELGIDPNDPLLDGWEKSVSPSFDMPQDSGVSNIDIVFEPSRIRSVNADFNPEYRDSPNLLAGVAGAMPYAAGTAALLAGVAPEEAEAGPLQTLGRAAPYIASAGLGGAMMTPQETQAGTEWMNGKEPISIMPPTYSDTMQRTQAALNKIGEFQAKRAGKRGAMDIMKMELQTLLKGANEVANDVIFPALDKPMQGYLGLSEVFGSLAQGRGFDTAMQRGAQVASQPTDATTYNMGGTVTDTLSPYVPAPVAAGAGALVHGGLLLASPF